MQGIVSVYASSVCRDGGKLSKIHMVSGHFMVVVAAMVAGGRYGCGW